MNDHRLRGKGLVMGEIFGDAGDGVIRDADEDQAGVGGGLQDGRGLDLGPDLPGGGGDFFLISPAHGGNGIAPLSGQDADGGTDFTGPDDGDGR